jgi:hypothetical protein
MQGSEDRHTIQFAEMLWNLDMDRMVKLLKVGVFLITYLEAMVYLNDVSR